MLFVRERKTDIEKALPKNKHSDLLNLIEKLEQFLDFVQFF